jgi:hypothetical protein
MKTPTLFGRCADYLQLTDEALADLITAHSTRPCRPRRAERIREGWEPVPAYAWTALKSIYEGHCPQANRVLYYVHVRGQNRIFVTKADMDCPRLGPILIRAALQAPPEVRIAYDPFAPPDEVTWGLMGTA